MSVAPVAEEDVDTSRCELCLQLAQSLVVRFDHFHFWSFDLDLSLFFCLFGRFRVLIDLGCSFFFCFLSLRLGHHQAPLLLQPVYLVFDLFQVTLVLLVGIAGVQELELAINYGLGNVATSIELLQGFI